MNQYREIKIAMSSRPTTASTVIEKPNRKAVWPSCLFNFNPIKTWATTMFGNKPAYVELDDDSEPLLDDMRAPRPANVVSSYMRRAASRTIRKYNRLP
ncbi:uncharacterized protein FIESC28_11606 [Fusarium coffeatum]|uniref:Uncharacterized protein n=1 Tax=Fusarium coffeatum TaxID=231269 RepID=A0A366QK24_9HYPO|nr:uncharacterized protein FIESC28_11606 [Fusarium coffeatum]RBR04210.1 hypothetical protein FIESC28_11606 [Fusarium coffeatum]